jgi:hypothetical protein
MVNMENNTRYLCGTCWSLSASNICLVGVLGLVSISAFCWAAVGNFLKTPISCLSRSRTKCSLTKMCLDFLDRKVLQLTYVLSSNMVVGPAEINGSKYLSKSDNGLRNFQTYQRILPQRDQGQCKTSVPQPSIKNGALSLPIQRMVTCSDYVHLYEQQTQHQPHA